MKIDKMEGCITQAKVESIIADGHNLILVDVRDEAQYMDGHIEQAINIPIDQLYQKFKSIESDIIIVTACGNGGGRSAKAVSQLQDQGFTKVKWLCGGTFGWKTRD